MFGGQRSLNIHWPLSDLFVPFVATMLLNVFSRHPKQIQFGHVERLPRSSDGAFDFVVGSPGSKKQMVDIGGWLVV